MVQGLQRLPSGPKLEKVIMSSGSRLAKGWQRMFKALIQIVTFAKSKRIYKLHDCFRTYGDEKIVDHK